MLTYYIWLKSDNSKDIKYHLYHDILTSSTFSLFSKNCREVLSSVPEFPFTGLTRIAPTGPGERWPVSALLYIIVRFTYLIRLFNLWVNYPQFPIIDKSSDYFFNTYSISLDPNTSHWLFVQIKNTEQKTGNNVSEFMYSNWITLTYYSSP